WQPFSDNHSPHRFLHGGSRSALSEAGCTIQERCSVLIRLTVPLQIAGVVAAVILMTHSPADAQGLKPIAVHAAQSSTAGQATAPPAGNQYVGASNCVACHDQTYTGTARGLKPHERTPARSEE